MASLQLAYPVKPFRVNQAFGACLPSVCEKYQGLGLNGHNGLDLWAPHDHPVHAAHDGVVVFAGEDGSAGYGVVIRTDEPFEYKGGTSYFKSIYWHLAKDGIRVLPGQHVKTGDLIGLADNTGLSTGDHLHFGLKPVYAGEQDWQWFNLEQGNGFKGAIDPAPYLIDRYADDSFRYTFARDLEFGSQGPDVRAWQTVLLLEGHWPVAQSLTEFFGRISETATKAYQRANGIVSWGTPRLTGYGRVGRRTRACANAKYSA